MAARRTYAGVNVIYTAQMVSLPRVSLPAWQDRVRDPSLTVLLVLQVFLLFVALPLAAVGVPIAAPVAWLVLFVALTFVVVLSRRSFAIVTILLGLAAVAASGLYPGERFFSAFALGRQWSGPRGRHHPR